MFRETYTAADGAPTAQVHLLGPTLLDDLLALQQRLVYETSGRNDRTATILLCEHPPEITIGRQGSRCDVRLSDATLEREQIRVRWLNRGGGTLLHCPGQLAAYVILPLARFGYTVGDFLTRLQAGLEAVADEFHLQRAARPGRRGVWARGGQAMFMAAAVKSWISYFGAYIPVDPEDRWLHGAASDPIDGSEAVSLAAALRRPVRMQMVRQSAAAALSTALGCERYHLLTGHPLLARTLVRPDDDTCSPKDQARAG
jgi:lipoyl(octanoyl) transferase